MKNLAGKVTTVKVFLLFLLAFGCITAVLVAFAIGRTVDTADSASRTAQIRSAMPHFSPARHREGVRGSRVENPVPMALRSAFYRAFEKDTNPAYRIASGGCAVWPKFVDCFDNRDMRFGSKAAFAPSR